MTKKELIDRITFTLEDAKTGVLATTDMKGHPRMRWMSPLIFPSNHNVLYAVTSPHFAKTLQLEKHPDVEWMLQTRSLNEVIYLHGKINLIDNPSLKAKIIEAIGKRLHIFWKIENNETDFIILETIIDEGIYFLPMEGKKETVSFR